MSDSPKLILARHLVGMLFAMLLVPYESYWIGWIVAVFFVTFVAGLIAGLALLFFTSHQRGKTLTTFITALWVVAFCVGGGMWAVIWPPAIHFPWIALIVYLARHRLARLFSRADR